MRDPPDKTMVKAPLPLQNLSDRWAMYLARDTATSSSVSNTCTFFSAVAAIDSRYGR
jgi:hypothetical protein